MAKDDYFVFVYKILEYLYACLRNKKKFNLDYLQPLSKDFPIEEDYFFYIIEKMYESNYIEGVVLVPILGKPHVSVKLTESLRITPMGIDFLQNNSNMQKAKDFLKEIKEMIPGL